MTYHNIEHDAVRYLNIEALAEERGTSPRRVLELLMQGVIDKISIAKNHMERGNKAVSLSHIHWAISIIDSLRMSLNKELEDEVITRLDALYDDMARRLLKANCEQDSGLLEEVSQMVKTIQKDSAGF